MIKILQLMPEILTQHVIPIELHYMNVRHLWGHNSEKWRKLGRQTREKQNYICLACGRKVPHIEGDYLELHENFTYDWENKIATIESMVCLCTKCHKYIHSSLLSILVRKGELTEEYEAEVLARGDEILAKHNLKKQEIDMSRRNDETWCNRVWKLMYGGQDLVPLLIEKRKKMSSATD